MNKKAKNRAKRALLYFYAPLAVLAILLVVFFTRGIYPFGTAGIDFYDMGQVNAALYYHLYDAMHGTKDLFFDWYSGFGINMSESVSIMSLISPFNLFFYFVDRDNLLQSLSLFTVIKMMGASLTMFVFLHKQYHATAGFWKVLFAIAYAFSGFAIQLYTNNQWLDVYAVLPLVALGFVHLAKTGRPLPYILALGASIIINYYSSAMVLLFLFLVGGLYIALLVPKEKRGRIIGAFGGGTMAAAGLSAVFVLPALLQMGRSARMGLGGGTLRDKLFTLLNAVNYTDGRKWMMLFGLSLAMVIIARGLFLCRKTPGSKRPAVFLLASMVVVTAPIIFENINLVWHGGSYIHFPLRFGFLIAFVFLCGACYYLPKSDTATNALLRAPLPYRVGFCLLCLLLTISLFGIYCFAMPDTAREGYPEQVYTLWVLAFPCAILFYSLLFCRWNRLVTTRLAAVTVVLTALIGAYAFMPVHRPAPVEQTSHYVATATALQKEMKPSQTDRVKNLGNTLNANYPFVLQVPSLSNYTHTIPGENQSLVQKLGYTINYTRLLDTGGTAFTDALFHFTDILSANRLEANALYSPIGHQSDYYLYKNLYSMPFGFAAPGTVMDPLLAGDPFSVQNELYTKLGGTGDILTALNGERYMKESTALGYRVSVSGKKQLYFSADCGDSHITLTVNGKPLAVPSVGREENITYPAYFNSGLLDLGTFDNESVDIKISGTSVLSPRFALLDIEKLAALTGGTPAPLVTAKPAALTVEVLGSAEKNTLFLPVFYDAGWACTVNGKKEEVQTAFGSFMAVDLQIGENVVELTFTPKGRALGLLISGATLLVVIGACFLARRLRKRGVQPPAGLLKFAGVVFFLLLGLALVFLYLLPMLYTLLPLPIKTR